MNNKISFRWYCVVVFSGFIPIVFSGCEPFPGADEFYEIEVSPERLREVETLDLQQAKSDEKRQTDVNDVTADLQSGAEAKAQAPPKELSLSLEQCRALVLENNLDLEVQLINPSIAAERVSEEEARFEAEFFSNASFNKTDRPVAYTLDISGSQVDYFNTDLGVRMPLRTGGTVTFDIADSRTKTDSAFSAFNPSYDSGLSLSISQPLLRNAGNRVNTHAIRLSKYDRQITDARTKLEVIRIVADMDRVYWRLFASRKELDVRNKQYELAEAQLGRARRFVDSGERAQIEIIRAVAGVAQQLESIIVAENNLRDRERELKRLLNKAGLEMQTPTVLIPITNPDPVHYEFKKHRLVQTAIASRMELLELEIEIAKDMSTMDYLHNQTLPLVTLDYTYNISGLGQSRNQSFDLLFDKRFEDHRLGLSLLVPLGNRAAKSRLYQAYYQRMQRLSTRKNRQAVIELEVLNAIDQLEANWQRVLASRQRAILDGRLFEAEKRQYELGLRTSTDVVEAQTNFADAQSAEILALAEYQIALVDLAYATGNLLGAAKIQWQPIVPERKVK